MEMVANTNGTYECPRCQKRTHAKIEANREDLEELAEMDSPAAELAELLVGGANERLD